jgi:hypothetical protein
MLGNRGGYRVIFVVAVAAMAVPCCAATIPPVVFAGQMYFDGFFPPINGPGTFTYGTGADFISATVLYADGDASLSASGSNTLDLSQEVDPSVTFSFGVFGSISEPVPLIFTASGSTSQTGPASGVNVSVFAPGGSLSACSEGAAAGQCTPGVPSSFSSTLHANATPGTIYQFTAAINGGSSDAVLGATWSATVDPEVEIDPSFADAGAFTLEFSPDPPAPEASSVLLLLAGCLALGAVAWFRSVRG